MQNLIFLGPVDTDVLGRTVVGNLGVKLRQFRYLNKIAEPFFLHDFIRYGKFVINGFLGEDGRPGVESENVLPLQCTWPQIFE